MEKIKKYQEIIKTYLHKFIHNDDDNTVKDYLICDDKNGHYQIVRTGWTAKNKFILDVIIYIQLKEDSKIWIIANWTENDLIEEISQFGINKEDFVLGFLPEYVRNNMELAA